MSKLPKFSDAKVLVIGDVMLDRFWHGATTRISPEAPVPVVKVAGVSLNALFREKKVHRGFALPRAFVLVHSLVVTLIAALNSKA